MATINLFLDSRANKDKAPLKVIIRNRKTSAMISLGLALSVSQWDKKTNKVVNHPQKNILNSFIRQKFNELENRLISEFGLNEVISASEIKEALLDRKEEYSDGVIERMSQYSLRSTAKRTKELYTTTIGRIKAFEQSKKRNPNYLTFEHITKNWLIDFDFWLSQNGCVSPNTRAIYMRNIRTVVNEAIEDKKTDTYGFKRFKIHTVETKKRALDKEDLQKLFNAEFDNIKERNAVDMFKLMFYLIGINIVDLYNVKEITNGRIEYLRTKTKHRKLYSILVEPEAFALIEKYRNDAGIIGFLHEYKDLHIATWHVNKYLKRACQRIGIPQVTTYSARHSWATIANDIDIDYSAIAQGLGHSAHSVTDVYIKLKMKKVDVANRKVIDYILYNKV